MARKILALFLVFIISFFTGCGGSVQHPQPHPLALAVTFYGDSLTQFWNLPQSFPGKSYTNDGHFGFTAAVLSDDFDVFVPSTHPSVVMILAGTNDVLQNDNADHIFMSLNSMYNKARSYGIPFVVSTIPPMAGAAGIAHNAVITDVNARLRSYASSQSLPLADYYSVLVDPATGDLQSLFSADNVHLTQAGYDAITPVAAKVIVIAAVTVR